MADDMSTIKGWLLIHELGEAGVRDDDDDDGGGHSIIALMTITGAAKLEEA